MRDYSIDFFKGVTVLSIIFIHTVWWSGQNYVPNIIAQISLLIDIPMFFFLSGASATYAFKSKNPFSGILRLLLLFLLFYIMYSLIFDPKNIVYITTNSLFLQYPQTPKLPVVYGSIWFIPIFVIVYIIGYCISKVKLPENVLPVICVFLFLFVLFFNYKPETTYYNLILNKIINGSPYLFYFIFGHYFYNHLIYKSQINTIALTLLIGASVTLFLYFQNIPFNLQNIKFPSQFYYTVASLPSIAITIILFKHINRKYLINYLGKNALYFYLAQGISSSFLYKILPIINLDWKIKLIIAFSLNLFLTTLIAITILKNVYFFN